MVGAGANTDRFAGEASLNGIETGEDPPSPGGYGAASPGFRIGEGNEQEVAEGAEKF